MKAGRAIRLASAGLGLYLAGRAFYRHLRRIEREIGCW